MAEKGLVLSGARARFLINGKVIGFATGVEVTENITFEPYRVLGNIEKEEDIPVSYDVQLSADMVRLVKNSLKSLGLMPKTGANTDEHLLNILNSSKLTAAIEDVATDTIVTMVEQVQISSQTWRVQQGQLVTMNVTFVAVRVKDESEI